MKILELRFKNLNSLSGQWCIDFSHPAYASECIFAITGPTGSGKSTILDAICLGIFGKTPRLGNITKSTNDIMSRQSGECSAEVMFETSQGRYRCVWQQHRAGKKPDGNLQEPRHELYDCEGNIIESKKTATLKKIEEVTGMTFEQFTRSILLAQGGFAAFLQAEEKMRSEILEQITGTEIYTQISLAVHQRCREEEQKYDSLHAGLGGIQVMTDEELAQIQTRKQQRVSEENQKKKQVSDTQKNILWIEQIKKLETELEHLSFEKEKINQEFEQFRAEHLKMIQAKKLNELEELYSIICRLRVDIESHKKEQSSGEQKLKSIHMQLQVREDEFKAAQNHWNRVRQEFKETAEVLKKVREADFTIKEKVVYSEKLKKEAVQVYEIINKLNLKIANFDKQIAENSVKKDVSEKYQRESEKDKSLIADLTGIKERFGFLFEAEKRYSAQKQKADKLQSEIDSIRNDAIKNRQIAEKLQDEYNGFCAKKNQLMGSMNELLQGKNLQFYRDEYLKILKKQQKIEYIANFEEERKKLVDNDPCPLCGSLHHPYATGNIPADNNKKEAEMLFEQIQKAEKYDNALKELDAEEKNHISVIAQAEKELAEKLIKEAELCQKMKEYSDECDNYSADVSIRLSQLKHILCRYDFEFNYVSEVSEIIEKLEFKKDKWMKCIDEYEKLDKELYRLKKESEAAREIVISKNDDYASKNEELQFLDEQIRELRGRRTTMFADKNPDHEEKKLQDAIESAERDMQKKSEAFDEIKVTLKETEVRIVSLNEIIAHNSKQCEQYSEQFFGKLSEFGIDGEAHYLAMRMSREKQVEIEEKYRNFEQKRAETEGKIVSCSEKVEYEKSRNLCMENVDDLMEKNRDLQEELKDIQKDVWELSQKISGNDAAVKQYSEQYEKMEKQRIEYRQWSQLHDLIGSQDGKKYRNFAQGLTFEMMIRHANQQLSKMTDRYILIRDTEKPLELNVMDNYQGAKIRTVKNLSGGESFLVSLSLALGLSQMASRKVRVDSLFLDEGFGTLDGDSLSVALETLAGLSSSGKIIGVISHVSALKEQINTQIQVIPGTAGQSVILGPGCKRV